MQHIKLGITYIELDIASIDLTNLYKRHSIHTIIIHVFVTCSLKHLVVMVPYANLTDKAQRAHNCRRKIIHTRLDKTGTFESYSLPAFK